MCANDTQYPGAADDVWDSDSGSEAGPRLATNQLDREWEARKQQYYNTGYREGVDQGKEVTLQQGFNAGFAEGARAGYEFGLTKGAVQVLASNLDEQDAKHIKTQQLQQQLSALNNKTVMQDTCRALLAGEPDSTISQHLQAALTIAGGDTAGGGSEVHSGAAADSSTLTTAGTAATAEPESALHGAADAPAEAAATASSSHTAELPLPLQLVAHLKQELLQLGFDVGAAPPLTVVVTSTSPAAAGSNTADE